MKRILATILFTMCLYNSNVLPSEPTTSGVGMFIASSGEENSHPELAVRGMYSLSTPNSTNPQQPGDSSIRYSSTRTATLAKWEKEKHRLSKKRYSDYGYYSFPLFAMGLTSVAYKYFNPSANQKSNPVRPLRDTTPTISLTDPIFLGSAMLGLGNYFACKYLTKKHSVGETAAHKEYQHAANTLTKIERIDSNHPWYVRLNREMTNAGIQVKGESILEAYFPSEVEAGIFCLKRARTVWDPEKGDTMTYPLGSAPLTFYEADGHRLASEYSCGGLPCLHLPARFENAGPSILNMNGMRQGVAIKPVKKCARDEDLPTDVREGHVQQTMTRPIHGFQMIGWASSYENSGLSTEVERKYASGESELKMDNSKHIPDYSTRGSTLKVPQRRAFLSYFKPKQKLTPQEEYGLLFGVEAEASMTLQNIQDAVQKFKNLKGNKDQILQIRLEAAGTQMAKTRRMEFAASDFKGPQRRAFLSYLNPLNWRSMLRSKTPQEEYGALFGVTPKTSMSPKDISDAIQKFKNLKGNQDAQLEMRLQAADIRTDIPHQLYRSLLGSEPKPGMPLDDVRKINERFKELGDNKSAKDKMRHEAALISELEEKESKQTVEAATRSKLTEPERWRHSGDDEEDASFLERSKDPATSKKGEAQNNKKVRFKDEEDIEKVKSRYTALYSRDPVSEGLTPAEIHECVKDVD